MCARICQFLSIALLLGLLSGCEAGLPEGEWDNPHDPDGTAYFPPIIGLRDTAIKDGASGQVQSFVRGQVAKVEACRWTVDGVSLETRTCSLSTTEWTLGNHVVTLSAFDTRGVSSPVTTAQVWIGNQPPKLGPIPYRRQSSMEELVQALVAEDLDGSIASVAWDTEPGRYGNESRLVRLPPSSWGGNRTIFWRAIDNEGASTESTFTVGLVPPPSLSIELDLRTIGSASSYNGVWTVGATDAGGNPKALGVIVTVELSSFSDEPFDGPTVTGSSGALSCVLVSVENPGGNGRKTYNCAEKAGLQAASTTFLATARNRFGVTGSAGLSVRRI